MPKVAIVSSDFRRANFMIGIAPEEWDVFLVDHALTDDEKAPLLEDVDAVIAFPADVSPELMRRCPKVKLVQTLSAGYDRLDVHGLGEMGIPVANNGGANAIAVAEHTLALMIGLGKRTMHQWEKAGRQRAWRQGLDLTLTEVTNKTVGIVGLGRVGQQVAKRLTGFDTNTIYYDIVDIPQDVRQRLHAEPVELDELLRESDIVSLHVPLTRRTRGMISDCELALMKPTAYLINACRGPVVDEKALHRALVDGQIAGAGLDVLEQEPTPTDNPLFDLDNVLITPHMAGTSEETNQRAADFAYGNIARVLAGEPPESVVTPED